MSDPRRPTVRQAARNRQPLGVADVQALEGAISLTESERDTALARLAQAEALLRMIDKGDLPLAQVRAFLATAPAPGAAPGHLFDGECHRSICAEHPTGRPDSPPSPPAAVDEWVTGIMNRGKPAASPPTCEPWCGTDDWDPSTDAAYFSKPEGVGIGYCSPRCADLGKPRHPHTGTP